MSETHTADSAARRQAGAAGVPKRRRLTDAEREQRRQWMKAAWAEGRFSHRRKGMPRRHWTPEQSRALATLAGTMPVPEIAAELERRFYLPRTEASLRIQAKRLGISLWPHGLGMRDLERLFGFDHRVIVKHWVAPGYLHGRRWQGRGPNQGWWFPEREVERFIREHGWLVDLDRMPKGHRLTRVAETALRADPWVCGLDDIGRVLGLAPVQIKKWMSRGLIPHERRPVAGSHGLLCVRGRDVPAIRDAIRAERERIMAANVARFTEWRRSRIGRAS
jgi:hypothetical protein